MLLGQATKLSPSKLSYLVVGCGSIGTRHLENLIELGAENVSGVEVDSERRREVMEDYGVEVFGNLEDGLESEPDVALICTPNHLHVPIATQAARTGCNLFIEKPLSHETDRVEKLLKEVDARDLVTLVGCNMRFHPAIRKIKELLKDQEVGTPLSSRIETGSYLPEWHPKEDYRGMYSAKKDMGGGAVLDCIHEIDYARWFFGDVKLVTGMVDKLSSLEIETEDTASIIAKFESGVQCEIHLDYVQRPYSRSCHIIGDNGTIRWEWGEGKVKWYTLGEDEWKEYLIPQNWGMNDMYLDEMSHFMDCLGGKDSPTCDVRDGLADLKIGLAAKRSSETGRHIET